MTIQYMRHQNAILDIIAEETVLPFGLALQWAHRTNAPELTDLYTAIADNAIAGGNCNAYSNAVYRATVILLDAWLESERKAA
nr:hypothetical protein [uncultured Halomonas sp.]